MDSIDRRARGIQVVNIFTKVTITKDSSGSHVKSVWLQSNEEGKKRNTIKERGWPRVESESPKAMLHGGPLKRG